MFDLDENLRFLEKFNTVFDFIRNFFTILNIICLILVFFGMTIPAQFWPRFLSGVQTQKMSLAIAVLSFTGLVFIVLNLIKSYLEKIKYLESLPNPYLDVKSQETVFRMVSKTIYEMEDTYSIKPVRNNIETFKFSFRWTGSGNPSVGWRFIDFSPKKHKKNSGYWKKVLMKKNVFGFYDCCLYFDPRLEKSDEINLHIKFLLPDPCKKMRPYLRLQFSKFRQYISHAKITLVFSEKIPRKITRGEYNSVNNTQICETDEPKSQYQTSGMVSWNLDKKQINPMKSYVYQWKF